MKEEPRIFIGIDVSKDSLEIAIHGHTNTHLYSNDHIGRNELCDRLKELQPERIVLEASGGYEILIATFLYDAGLPVSLVNPSQIKGFANAIKQRAKTDKLDALLIARFAKDIYPELTVFKTETQRKIRLYMNRRSQLISMLSVEKTRYTMSQYAEEKELIKESIIWLEAQIQDMEEKVNTIIKTTPEFQEKMTCLLSFKGVGSVVATTLIAQLPELGMLNKKEIAALVGLAPMNHDSGKKKGKRMICGGRGAIRRILYMAILSAIKHNVMIKEFYTRLIENGKPKKVAMVACMRKMIVILNAMVRDNQAWKYA